VDFLFVLIELFFAGCYTAETLRSNTIGNQRFWRGQVSFDKIFTQ